MMNPFLRTPSSADDPVTRRRYLKPGTGLHLFFRHTTREMQARFVELARPSDMPVAFLHGNPHLDNYARNSRGAAMVDFDRSRFGPYGYDIVRFLISLTLRARRPGPAFWTAPVRNSFRRGYVQGLLCPELGIEEMDYLRRRREKKWQRSTAEYMRAGKAWAKKLRDNQLDPKEPKWGELLEVYAQRRREPELCEDYEIAMVGRAGGSMGKDHTLFWLKARREGQDSILLDFKDTYSDPDTDHFYSPFVHQGERMCRAGELYAPGWDLRPGFLTHENRQLWVRQIPTYQVKVRRALREADLMDLGFAVGTQLGRGHGESVQKIDRQALAKRYLEEYDDLIYIAATMTTEIRDAHRRYADQTKKSA